MKQLGESHQVVGAPRAEHTTAGEDHGPLRRGQEVKDRADVGRRRRLGVRAEDGDLGSLRKRQVEHVLGKGDERRTGPSLGGRPDGVLQRCGRGRRVVDLARPFGEPADGADEIDLLERLPAAQDPIHLAHQDEHRRRVRGRRVDPDGEVRGSDRTRGQAGGRTAGQLSVGLGRKRGGPLVAGGDDPNADRGHGIQHGQEALARDREGDPDARSPQGGCDQLGHGPRRGRLGRGFGLGRGLGLLAGFGLGRGLGLLLRLWLLLGFRLGRGPRLRDDGHVRLGLPSGLRLGLSSGLRRRLSLDGVGRTAFLTGQRAILVQDRLESR